MDLHSLKLVGIALAAALVFAVWLTVFLRAQGIAGFVASLLLFLGMMGLFASGYLMVALMPDMTAQDVGVITGLSIFFCLLVYLIGLFSQAWRR